MSEANKQFPPAYPYSPQLLSESSDCHCLHMLCFADVTQHRPRYLESSYGCYSVGPCMEAPGAQPQGQGKRGLGSRPVIPYAPGPGVSSSAVQQHMRPPTHEGAMSLTPGPRQRVISTQGRLYPCAWPRVSNQAPTKAGGRRHTCLCNLGL